MNSHFYSFHSVRRILILLTIVFTWSVGKSQQHIHMNETFTGYPAVVNPFPINGWSNTIVQGQFAQDFWRFYNPGGRTISAPASGQVAIFDGNNYSNDGLNEDVSLTTPIVDARGYNNVWVKFDQHFEAGNGSIWAIEAFDGATWVQVASGNSQINWQTSTYDISTWCANKATARVRFRWRANNAFWWMLDNIQIYSNVSANNAATVEAKVNGGQCGATNDNVAVTVRNVSNAPMSNIPVKLSVVGTIGSNPVNSVISANVAGPLAPGQTTVINMGPVNTLLGGTLDFKSYTEVVGDPQATNDTTKVTGYSIFGTPPLPTGTDVSRCGAGTVVVDGGILSGNTGLWYTSMASTNPFYKGSSYTTGLMTPPATQTFFVSQARTSSQRIATTNFPGGVWWGAGQPCGNMFTMTTVSNIIIDSIAAHIPNVNVVDVSVYYKTGSFVGFETNPGAWTLLDKVSVRGRGTGQPTMVNVADLNIPAGQTVSFFVESSSEMVFNSGSTNVINNDFTLSLGNTVYGLFVTWQNDFTWNGNIYYRIFCESAKVQVKAEAKPAPQNAGFTSGTPFKGTLNAGNIAVPDIVASPDQITYDIMPATGFPNTQYNNTWTITGLDFRTLNGTPVPTADYQRTDPTLSGNNGKVAYTPSAAYTDSTVRLRVTIKRNDNQCDTVIERIIYIAPRPKPQFTINDGCQNDVVVIDNTSSILKGTLTYFWDFGDGTTSTLAQPVKKFPAFGTYNVKLIVTSDYGYKDSMTKTINVFRIPGADFKFVNACEGTAVTFADNSSLPPGTPTFEWNFGDATTGTGATPSRLYGTPGIYNVSMKVTVNGCSSSTSKFVTQAPRATPDFSFTATQCDNGVVDFKNNSTDPAFGTVSYLWKFGDGKQATADSVKHTYNVFAPYNVVLIANTDLGCSDSIVKSVTLRQSPKAGFTHSSSLCNNQPINFTNTSVVPTGSNTYEWDFGDGNASQTPDPTHQFSGPGTYTVKLTSFSSNGCSSQTDMVVTINLKPVAAFSVQDVCEGTPVAFDNGSIASDNSTLTYNWKFGNGDSSAVTDPTKTYAPGTYNVSLTATHSNGCSDVATASVSVNPKPVPVILVASKQGGDGSFAFTSTTAGTGYKYLWLFGDGGSSQSKDTSYTYIVDGLKNISLRIITDKGCEGVATQSIIVNRLSVKDLSGLEGKVSVYPNPSAGRFTIDLSRVNSEDVTGMTVTDMLGRTIAGNIKTSAGIAEVNLEEHAAGIYYLNISTATGTHSVKLNVSR